MATPTVKVTVTVTGDPNNPTLTLSPLNVDLNSGDVLEWDFQGVPSDCVPGILFDSAFGPFQALDVQGKSVVLGLGNLGTGGDYPYRAQLLDLNGVRATSPDRDKDKGTVHNLVSVLDTSPSVVIQCQTMPNSETPGGLDVTSSLQGSGNLSLFVGDMAIWYVTGLPFGYFVSFRFPADTDSGEDSTVGPFKSFLFTRGVGGESSGAVEVIGVGFNPPADALNPITYHIDIRDTFGVVVSHQDPIIDNLGQPPTGGT